MIVSEKQKGYRNKWDKKHMKTLGCKVKKEQAEAFKQYAKAQGKTVNELLKEYIIICIDPNKELNVSEKMNPDDIDIIEWVY